MFVSAIRISSNLDGVTNYVLLLVGLAIGNDATGDEETGSTEELLAAMEKVGVLFDRLKACGELND